MSVNTRYLFVVVAVAMLSGCLGSLKAMSVARNQTITDPSEDTAQIVFFRVSTVGATYDVDLFEIQDSNIKFIGALRHEQRFAYETTPGRKVFMAHSKPADFMIADVAPGMTYYVLLRPIWISGGFAPTPIRSDGSTDYNTSVRDFDDWITETTLVQTDDAQGQAWFDTKKDKIAEVYEKYWQRFQAKTDAQKEERILRPEDGVRQ